MSSRRRFVLSTLTLALLATLAPACTGRKEAGQAPAVKVAAAADLAFAFEELGRLFEQAHPEKVTFVYGSSGLLARQLIEGAPYDAFFAADTSFVDSAIASGACAVDSRVTYARGHLVVWAHEGAAVRPSRLADLADPRFKRIAIANPAHAPYGRAARQALERAGLWEAVKARVALGDNVRQALQFAQSQNAEAAIIALSLATAVKEGRFFPVDEALHAPIEQTAVACRRGANLAGGRKFLAFISSVEGQAVLRRHGFAAAGGEELARP